jgi:hypothetical protein
MTKFRTLLSPSHLRPLSLARPPPSHPHLPRLYSTLRPPANSLRLSEEEQRIFDELVRRASQPPPSTPASTSSPASAGAAAAAAAAGGGQATDAAAKSTEAAQAAPDAEAQQLMHPDARKGAPPEFEGEVNPKTGEVGGPKNEPLRWGAQGDWSFNGRTTDF